MSTSACIQIKQKNRFIAHRVISDGYPTFMLDVINDWLDTERTHEALAHCYGKNFGPDLRDEMTEEVRSDDISYFHFGGGDWVYQLDVDAGTITTFHDGYIEHVHDYASDTPISPLLFIHSLYPECQESERQLIELTIESIEAKGIRVLR